ncbi:hypothetical protein KI688_005272 [Linnemannia hyalina]|uniref:SWIM-type domain-containing protein n=1 Tax=Linnemannia hyalina TaxID=64524 RepID=A0A9P7XK44_9FUNG|nr:hypothetical protein KI688_005272 [Linnemannia hyalina]
MIWEMLSKPLVDYMEENYLKERRRQLWMKSYRQDVYYASMDTSNYVESWHNQLKSNHLKHHYRARADRILYILTEVVLEAFKKDEFGAIIRVGRRTKGEVLDILRQRDVQAMTEETIQKNVLIIDARYIVESITFPVTYYNLSLTDGLANSCSCEYFLRHRRLCKHILMAFRKFLGNLRLPFNNDFYVSRTLTDFTTASDFKQEDIKRDETPEDEREQNRLRDRARALVESFSRCTRDAIMTEETIRILELLVDHGGCLLKEG